VDVDGKIILKWIFQDSCKYSNEPFGSIRGEFDQLSDYQFLAKDSAPLSLFEIKLLNRSWHGTHYVTLPMRSHFIGYKATRYVLYLNYDVEVT